MTSLTNILTAQTADFKAVYIEKTKAFAVREFARFEKIAKWDTTMWCKYFGIEPRIYTQFGQEHISFPIGFHGTKNARTYDSMKNKAIAEVRKGLDAFVAMNIENAENHYASSIEKLAARVSEKGLNIDSIEVTSGFQDVNFECTITDGSKKVRAFTIIAEGEIVRPHYRYLIK